MKYCLHFISTESEGETQKSVEFYVFNYLISGIYLDSYSLWLVASRPLLIQHCVSHLSIKRYELWLRFNTRLGLQSLRKLGRCLDGSLVFLMDRRCRQVQYVTVLPDVQPGQHGCGSTPEHPDSEENNEQRSGEHHLAGVGGCVADGQGERHRPTQTWRRSDYSLSRRLLQVSVF